MSQKKILQIFAGSAGPLPFDDGYLALVHQFSYEEGRYYFHRFIYLDKDFKLTRLSKPFTFLHSGIEYCCGMTFDPSCQNLLMTIGIEDRQAGLVTVNLETVRGLLSSFK